MKWLEVMTLIVCTLALSLADDTPLLQTAAWFSAAIAMVAITIMVWHTRGKNG